MSKRNDPAVKINAIRSAARAKLGIQESGKCPTCCRDHFSPHRVYDTRGKVVEGCVDACHTGQLYGESAFWHARPAAVSIRRETLKSLMR